MQRLKQRVKEINKIFAIALLASVLAIPLAVSTYAQSSSDPEQQAQDDIAVEIDQEEVLPEEEAPLPSDDEEAVEEDEEAVEEEEEVIVPQEVTLAEAIAIAQAEHPNVEVVTAKVTMKKLDGDKAYKIVFADGWRLYVRASDGEIVRIKDASNKKHDCSKRGHHAVADWRAKFQKKWGHKPVNHQGPKRTSSGFVQGVHHIHGWPKPGQQQKQPGQPAEVEVPVEQ